MVQRSYSIILMICLSFLLIPLQMLRADMPGTYTWSNAPGGSVTASIVDFEIWMEKLSQFMMGGNYHFSYLAPTTADINGNGILDVNEFSLIKVICNNPNSPYHNLVHEAFKANQQVFADHLGNFLRTLAYPLTFVYAGYATLGDGMYFRSPMPSFAGSWGAVAEILYSLDEYGSPWDQGQPTSPPYQRLKEYLSVCGDLDGDGVENFYEWFGQNQDLPSYLNAVVDPNIKIRGQVPQDILDYCALFRFEWGKTFFYNPSNQRVYHLQPYMTPWENGEWWARNYKLVNNRGQEVSVPAHLVKIDNAEENQWIKENIMDRRLTRWWPSVWIGATDKYIEGQWIWIATGEQFWEGGANGTPVGGRYANWAPDEPNNANDEDFAELYENGTWNDEKRTVKRFGLIEFDGTYPDNNNNGVPDFWEQFSSDENYEPEGEPEGEVCQYDGVINDPTTGRGPLLASTVQNLSATVADILRVLEMQSWFDWDVEFLHEVINAQRMHPGDTLKDSWSMALLEYCLCHPSFRAELRIPQDYAFNKNLFAQDCNWLAEHVNPNFAEFPGLVGDVMAGLLGLSVEMRSTWDGLFRVLTGNVSGLPNANNYRIFGLGKAGVGVLSAQGDLDNDGKTNLEEATLVLSVDGDMALFVQAATDRHNFWRGNPELPLSTVVTIGAMTGLSVVGGVMLLLKRRGA